MSDEIKDLPELVIDRAKWGRGRLMASRKLEPEIVTNTAINEYSIVDGKMCCLGFYCLAAGYTPEELTINVPAEKRRYGETAFYSPGYPFLLDDGGARLPTWLQASNPDNGYPNHMKDLTRINDDTYMSFAEKERRITEIFAQHGTKVTFVGEFEAPPT